MVNIPVILLAAIAVVCHGGPAPKSNDLYDWIDWWFSSDNPKIPIPDPDNKPEMARYIVHISDWTSIAYISHAEDYTKNLPIADMFAVSDGLVSDGRGVPYFYVSKLQAAVTDLINFDNKCSIMMSLAQSDVCKSNNWDPEDPRCAHVILSGTFARVSNETSEYKFAEMALFTRHPSFVKLPENHHFFVAKLNIGSITLQDTFGGPNKVSVFDYFSVKSEKFNLTSLNDKLLITNSLGIHGYV